MVTYLDRILDAHRVRAADDHRDLDALIEAASAVEPARGFGRAIAQADGLAVIAEIKRRSPSKGDLNAGLDPAALARAYAVGGAACLSVLTDGEFFGGSAADLQAARAAAPLPVLRKDFTVSPRDVADARLMGADCVLIIVAALSESEVKEFCALSSSLGLDALVETHDEAEVEVALGAGATIIGVNQRDLVTFAVDPSRAQRVVASIPAGVLKVAESGIGSPAAAKSLADAGYDAVLVGEHLVTSGDPSSALRALRGV